MKNWMLQYNSMISMKETILALERNYYSTQGISIPEYKKLSDFILECKSKCNLNFD